MYPTLEKIKELAQSGEYRRIPVCRELYSDRYTPVEVMRNLRTASRHCYLLESASQTEVWGRYSFLGYEPSMEITCTDGKLQIRRIHEDGTEEKTHILSDAFWHISVLTVPLCGVLCDLTLCTGLRYERPYGGIRAERGAVFVGSRKTAFWIFER